VVSNRHVVQKARKPVVRINRKDGSLEYVSTTIDQWRLHPDGDDVAIFPLDIDWQELNFFSIPSQKMVTNEIIVKHDIGIGDDTFMIGRFINHEGKQQNTPSIRFGNIAMMPKERIVSEDGLAQESFLVEIRSLPGYSGSAVFIYSVTPMMDFSNRDLKEEEEELRDKERKRTGADEFIIDPGSAARFTPKGPFLLGIDWCHLHTVENVREKNGAIVSEGLIVRTNSGMAGVVPAWKIADLLNDPEMVEMRKQTDRNITQNKQSSRQV